jgi:uncharacterized protein
MSPELFYITILLITGVGVGFLTGLLGVGGGFILVPIQFFLLESIGVDPTTALRIAFGTSLAVILPTAISGTHRHYTKGLVLIRPALYMGISGIIGGFLGGSIATHVPGDYLKIIFGSALLLVAVQMLIFKGSSKDREKVDNIYYYLFWGFIAGLMSGLVGIGGGVILVPVMVLIFGFSMIEAVGTSTMVIIFTSIGGIVAYILNGLNITGLPPYSLGYINLLQLVILAGMSVPMAQLGATAAHKVSNRLLRYSFVILLIYMALKMLGVFSWLGIPL